MEKVTDNYLDLMSYEGVIGLTIKENDLENSLTEVNIDLDGLGDVMTIKLHNDEGKAQIAIDRIDGVLTIKVSKKLEG